MGGAQHGGRTTVNRDGTGLVVVGEPGVSLYHRGSATSERSSPVDDGRVALVSGGNRGLGLQIVRMLAEQGMRVVLASRSVQRGQEAVELLGSLAERVAVRQLDIIDGSSVARLVSWLDRRLRRCDVLVNNAAVLFDDNSDSPTNVDLDMVRRTLETNLFGTWRLTQSITPLMRSGRYGRIVNISSSLGSLTSMGRGLPAYRASKCAVNALTCMLADELAQDGILVNACCPGPEPMAFWDAEDAVQMSSTADTAVWLATLPDGGPTGGLYRRRKLIDW